MLQQMEHIHVTITLLLLVSIVGCEDTSPPTPSKPLPVAEVATDSDKELRREIEQARHDADEATAPESLIKFPLPPGWVRSSPQALPPEDNGFTVDYEHESGLFLTLYQFTGSFTHIPDDVNSAEVREEMAHAKLDIQRAVDDGHYDAAVEQKAGVVQLGDSDRSALWCQYQITIDGEPRVSDIYVWAHANTFLKLRCTNRSSEVLANQPIIHQLLTEFGLSLIEKSE